MNTVSARTDRSVRIGIDIGGTFTDLLLVDDRTGEFAVGKTLTTPDDPSMAVARETADVLAATGIGPDQVQTVIHGTTLVTNAIIERKGSPTALLTTKGFRDALEIRREHRYEMYDVLIDAPRPLVPRYLRVELDERVLADGTVLHPLDAAHVRRVVAELARKGIEAIAVSLLHSYRNPEHERRIATIIAEVAPDLEVSLSSDVVPEIKEYERTSTTVCNVYVKSLVARYLAELERRLETLGIEGRLYVMLSSGGIATIDTCRQFPIRLLESGPAAGALAAAHLGRSAGYHDVFSFDMGGTTAKLCIIERGEPLTTSQIEVDRIYRFKKGSGLPVKIPVIEMIEIGAGGGSIAHVDALGLLKVGPESAGADPGPACYGRHSRRPTVTDADLVLGYLDAKFFLGGKMELDEQMARAAIREEVAKPLGLDVTDAAWGIHQIVNENMANAARIHAIERGKDPRTFPLFAFGGAGPVHAFAVGSILHSPGFIVPFGAGVGSAIGFLAAPLSFDFVRTSVERLRELDWSRLNALFEEMETDGIALLERSGLGRETVRIRRAADLRFVGQGHEIPVPIPAGRLGPERLDEILGAFARVYRQLYGRLAEGDVESLNWRLVASGPRPRLTLGGTNGQRSTNATVALKGQRPVFFPPNGYQRTPVYDRYTLGPGARFEGPAIVEERESTVVIGASASVSVDKELNLIVEYGHES